jgi:hypothetical protein
MRPIEYLYPRLGSDAEPRDQLTFIELLHYLGVLPVAGRGRLDYSGLVLAVPAAWRRSISVLSSLAAGIARKISRVLLVSLSINHWHRFVGDSRYGVGRRYTLVCRSAAEVRATLYQNREQHYPGCCSMYSSHSICNMTRGLSTAQVPWFQVIGLRRIAEMLMA